MAAGEPVLYSLYVYAPNKWAPIIFITLYGISAKFHLWQCYRYEAFRLIGLHPVCAILFTAGYSLREYGSYNYLYSETSDTPLMVFVMSQVFIYICPPPPRTRKLPRPRPSLLLRPPLRASPPRQGPSRIRRSDLRDSQRPRRVICFHPFRTNQELGSRLTLAAIGLQLVLIVTFICLAAFFHTRVTKAKIRSRGVTTMLLTLYTSMALIFVRCIYRLVEHTGSTDVDLDNMETLRGLGHILRNELYFYVFEATLCLSTR